MNGGRGKRRCMRKGWFIVRSRNRRKGRLSPTFSSVNFHTFLFVPHSYFAFLFHPPSPTRFQSSLHPRIFSARFFVAQRPPSRGMPRDREREREIAREREREIARDRARAPARERERERKREGRSEETVEKDRRWMPGGVGADSEHS